MEVWEFTYVSGTFMVPLHYQQIAYFRIKFFCKSASGVDSLEADMLLFFTTIECKGSIET